MRSQSSFSRNGSRHRQPERAQRLARLHPPGAQWDLPRSIPSEAHGASEREHGRVFRIRNPQSQRADRLIGRGRNARGHEHRGVYEINTLCAREQYSTRAQHIPGCTTMYSISRKGVYPCIGGKMSRLMRTLCG